jgi:hypothetical protein
MASELPSKMKGSYAPLILAGSCQWHLDWRRLGWTPARHRRCGPGASTLTIKAHDQRLYATGSKF